MTEMVKNRWRPGLMIGLIIAGLILINASVFFSDNNAYSTQRLWHYLNPWHWPGWYAANLWFIFAGLLVALFAKNKRVQSVMHSFYASNFWRSVKSRLKNSRPNQAIVNFVPHRRIGKWLLRKWSFFWASIKVERYPAYSWILACLAVCLVIFNYSAFTETPRKYLWFYFNYPRVFFIHQIYEPFYFEPLIDFNFNGRITWRLLIAPLTGLALIVCLLRAASKSKKKRRVS